MADEVNTTKPLEVFKSLGRLGVFVTPYKFKLISGDNVIVMNFNIFSRSL